MPEVHFKSMTAIFNLLVSPLFSSAISGVDIAACTYLTIWDHALYNLGEKNEDQFSRLALSPIFQLFKCQRL